MSVSNAEGSPLMARKGDNGDTEEGEIKEKMTFLRLPEEVQKEIIAQCSQSDLICLSLVSKQCRELAAAQLYRNFHIVFPDEDDPAYDSPIDGLAGGLETFVTSDYDYAKHLRDLSLDTLSAGDKAETAYKAYVYSVSCGKFMNTLLLLTLRKAKSLETFKWNIRVELSRQVYKALHSIDTLRNVHIRLQAGPSLYETPPPLPYSSSLISSPVMPSLHMSVPDPGGPGAPSYVGAQVPASLGIFASLPGQTLIYTNSNQSTVISGPPLSSAPKHISLRGKPKKSPASKEPPTLSAFKKLRSLSVLDMDSLDVVTEIKSCIRNSASTLTKLKLSFSDRLAMQARKPPPEADIDDSDQEDEFQVVPGPSHPGLFSSENSLSMPARTYRAAEERKSQEAALGRIFDVEPYLVKKPTKRIPLKEKEPEESPAPYDPGKEFITSIREVSARLLHMKETPSSEISAAHQQILDTIEAAARKYVAAEGPKVNPDDEGASNGNANATINGDSHPSPSPSPELTTDKAEEASSVSAPASTPASTSASASGVESESAGTSGSSLKSGSHHSTKGAARDESPDDINIEEPEEQLVLDGQETPKRPTEIVTENGSPSAATPKTGESASASGSGDSPSLDKAMANLTAQKVNFTILAEKLSCVEEQADSLTKEIQTLGDLAGVALAEARFHGFSRGIDDIQREMRTVRAEMADAKKQTLLALATSDAADSEAQGRRVSEYIRETRGLGLTSLSIYLVPVKASVLSRAIDLRVLKTITLLNVGPQGPIWALFAKENKIQPLPLRKIFTDNVTPAFLTFVSQLEELHEFFILERDHKYKPESFAAKATTTNEQIRRLVLRRHLPTLRRLMIKNMDTMDWDCDELTTRLLCRKGKNLEELAVSMNIRAVHTLMQNISGLANLHALHIISLRNDDTCVWVMRETKEFLIDNLSHHPEMKLEWISIDDDDRLEKIVRYTDAPKKSKKSRGKEKEKAPLPSSSGPNGNAGAFPFSSFHANAADLFPVLPAVSEWDDGGNEGDDGSEAETDEDEAPPLKLETLKGVHFYDVWGVKIFKKEIVNGRL